MSPFLKLRRPQPPPVPTFKSRVEQFWGWYADVADRFYQTIQAGRCADLAAEVSTNVDRLLPGMAWVFGPGANRVGHSFTLSGEGVLHKQLLAIHCVSRAPKLNGWTFYDSRQPGSIEGIRMDINGQKFDPMEFWITPTINQEDEQVDIVVWHPLFSRLNEKDRLGPLFLFLDEVLGEFGTGQWIGDIKLNDQRLADAMPLNELRPFIANLQETRDWKKLPPGEAATVYRCGNPDQRFLRSDVFVGTTMHPRLVNEYLTAEGNLADPILGTGADFVFVAIDARIFPDGKQTEVRGAIEDALDAALKAEHSGRLLGGAFGTQFAYIDLLLFDGANSLEVVKRILREQQAPAGTAIHYFSKDKREQSVVL